MAQVIGLVLGHSFQKGRTNESLGWNIGKQIRMFGRWDSLIEGDFILLPRPTSLPRTKELNQPGHKGDGFMTLSTQLSGLGYICWQIRKESFFSKSSLVFIDRTTWVILAVLYDQNIYIYIYVVLLLLRRWIGTSPTVGLLWNHLTEHLGVSIVPWKPAKFPEAKHSINGLHTYIWIV